MAKSIAMFAIIFSIQSSAAIAALEARIDHDYVLGDEVKVVIHGAMDHVTVESSLLQASFDVSTAGAPTTVSVGRVKKPGFWSVKFTDGKEQSAICVFVLPKEAQNATFVPVSESGLDKSGTESTLIRRFWKAVRKEDLKVAVPIGLGKFLHDNPIGLATTMTVCTAAPFFKPAIRPCAIGAAKNSTELLADVLLATLDTVAGDGRLTPSEHSQLKKYFSTGNFLAQLGLADAAIEKFFEITKAVVEGTVSNEQTKLFYKWSVDESGRVMLLLKLANGVN